MSLEVFFGLIAIVVGLIYYWFRKQFSFFEENGFEHEKPTFPFGNLKGVGSELRLSEKIDESYKKFKGKAPAFGIYFFTNPTVVLTDLDVIKDVLFTNFDTFHNRGVYYNLEDDPLSGHLFALEDSDWKNMRAKLTPTFSSGKMKMVFNTIVDISDRMISHLKKESSTDDLIEMKDNLAKFATDVIGNIAFGLEMNSIEDPNSMFREMGRQIFKTKAIKIQLLAGAPNLGRKLHLRFFDKNITDFFSRTVRETVDYRTGNNIQRNDLMDLLIKLWDHDKPEEGKITFNELAAQCFVFFIAGRKVEIKHNHDHFST